MTQCVGVHAKLIATQDRVPGPAVACRRGLVRPPLPVTPQYGVTSGLLV